MILHLRWGNLVDGLLLGHFVSEEVHMTVNRKHRHCGCCWVDMPLWHNEFSRITQELEKDASAIFMVLLTCPGGSEAEGVYAYDATP